MIQRTVDSGGMLGAQVAHVDTSPRQSAQSSFLPYRQTQILLGRLYKFVHY